VLTVLGYHAGVSWLPGGMLGVDVFFVLSGFLITSLLLTEYRNGGRISLARFWGRRAKRLLPAMALLLAAMIAWAAYVSPASSRASLRGDVFSTLGYVANWRFILSGQGYFDHFAPQSPLLHTWSVSVEEQFYLLWPILLLLVLRWRRRGVFALAIIGATASAVLMAVLSLQGASPDRLYYGTDTRALPLLLGCALAALRPAAGFDAALSRLSNAQGQRAGRAFIQLAGLAGAAGLVLCWLNTQDRSTWLYRGGFAVVALSAAGVLLSCSDAPRGPLSRLLSFGPLRYIGMISYGLYLYHWPIFQYLTHARTGWGGSSLLALRFAVTLAVAIVSYHLIEQPIRRGTLSLRALRRRLPRRAAAAALPAVSLLVVAALVAGISLVSTQPASRLAASGAAAGSSATPVQPPKPKPPVLNAAQRAILNRPIRVLVEGDSLATTLGVGLGQSSSQYNYQSFNLGTLGCGVARGAPARDDGGLNYLTPKCQSWPQIRANDVQTYDPDVAVLLTGRWEVLDRVHDGQWMHVGEPAFDAYLASELDLAINVLSAGGAKVLLLTTPCFAPEEQPDGSVYPFDDPARLQAYNNLLRAAAARHSATTSVYDLDKQFCPTGEYTAAVNGITIRTSDGIHISDAGGQYAAKALGPLFTKLGSVRRQLEASKTHANEAHTAPSS
jgi:peptidoglycan/LPS O-acetylase OafA/YrhL